MTFVRMLLEGMVGHFTILINRKESRKAFELVKEVEVYLPLIKDRIRDKDPRVRETVQATLKACLLGMETDLANEKTIEDVFLTLIKNANPKIVE